MGLFKNYVNQTRKPEGFLGKMMIKGMNSGHAKMADWGMHHLKTIAPAEIIDIGKATATLEKLMRSRQECWRTVEEISGRQGDRR